MYPYSTDELLIHWDDRDGVVHVCGPAGNVDEFMNVFRSVRSALEDQLARAKQRIVEKFSLKSHQISLLRTLNFGAARKDVRLSFTETEVVLSGQLKCIQQVKLEILQKASSMVCSSLQCWSEGVRRLLEKPEVKKYFRSLFENARLQVVVFAVVVTICYRI